MSCSGWAWAEDHRNILERLHEKSGAGCEAGLEDWRKELNRGDVQVCLSSFDGLRELPMVSFSSKLA